MRYQARVVAAAVATLVVAGCASSEPASPTVNQLSLHYEGTSAKQVSMEVGVTLRVIAETRDASGNLLSGLAIQYRSSKPELVAVSAAGVVSARAEGTAYVIATARVGTTTFRDSVVASVARSLRE